MAYLYSTGSRGLGDIEFEGDPAETQIDFEDDFIALKTGGNQVLVVAGSDVGIGTSTPDYTLDVAGNMGIDEYIYHNGDADTTFRFRDDRITLHAGNLSMIDMEKKGSAPHEVTINNGNNNVDFVVKGNGSNGGNPGIKFDGSTNRLGINGVGNPSYELDVAGDIGISEKLIHKGDDNTYLEFPGANKMNLVCNGYSFLDYHDGTILINSGSRDRDTQIKADNGNIVLHVDAGDNRVGIGTSSPDCTLNVAGALAASGPSKTFQTFANGDYTPSLANGNLFKTYDGAGQGATSFDDGVAGQIVTIISTDAFTYMVSAGNLKGGSTDITTAATDVTTWIFDGTYWYLMNFMDQSADLSGGH